MIASTVGSAVGLGNIWRFPYEAGVHGGGAFMMLDILFVLMIGIPVLCAEFIIGRHTGQNIRGAFRALAPGKAWGWMGYVSITAAIGILSFYSVVAGWTIEYFCQAVTSFDSTATQEQLHSRFDAFATGDVRPLVWTVVFLAINFFVVVRSVEKGIERVSNILMPLLAVILIACCVNSLCLPGAREGLDFLFRPDFSKVTPKVVIGAMGQAFFSLSLGLGCMVTYASYFRRQDALVRTATTTALLDTLVAILAGVIIFPAVFTFGAEAAAGPKLVFEVLPSLFAHMPAGQVWEAAFFLLLFIASLTSTISMSEIAIAYFVEETGMKRRTAAALTIGISMLLGCLCALSFGSLSGFTICGLTIFNLFDYVTSNIILPLGGLVVSVFVGWVLDRSILRSELAVPGREGTAAGRRVVHWVVFCLRYVTPACILTVFIAGLIG